MSIPELIFEEEHISKLSPTELDERLANGWRYFGNAFFRYNLSIHEGKLCHVLPFRLHLPNFTLSKSQRKILKKNKQFSYKITPIVIDEEKELLFHEHKQKFKDNIPDSIYVFLSRQPDVIPCKGLEVSIYDQQQLIAVSFMGVGQQSISSIYAMYALNYSSYSLGLYTMLLEISFAREHNIPYYYHGYGYNISSFYDYKKKFKSLEYFDWEGNWLPYPQS